MKKLFSILISMVLILSCGFIQAFAGTSAIGTSNIPKAVDSIPHSSAYYEFIKANPNAILVSKNQVYCRFDETADKGIVKKDFTPAEFKALNITSANTVSPMNLVNNASGWITIWSYGFKNPNTGKYFLELAYDWLILPVFQMSDAVALCADANVVISTSSVKIDHFVTTADLVTYEYVYNYLNTPDISKGTNSYGANVPLKPNGSFSDAWGYLTADATWGNQQIVASKYYVGYAHRQIAVTSPGFSFSTSPAFNFSFVQNYDSVTLADTINK